jgi:hypothetical protein
MKIGVVPAQEASFGDVLIYFLPKLRFSARDEIDCMGHLRRKPCSLVNPSALPPLFSSTAAGCGHCRCWQGATHKNCPQTSQLDVVRKGSVPKDCSQFQAREDKDMNLFHS